MTYNNTFILFLLLILFASQTLLAQRNTGKIIGQILEASSNNPLEFATITIFSKLDSAIVTGGVSNQEGKINLIIPNGFYFAKINFIGLKENIVDSIWINKSQPTYHLDEIKLYPKIAFLNKIEVTGEKQLVQIALDKRIYNVSKDLSNTGGSAIDVLDNLPGVAVELGDVLTLRGSRGVQILIDGKPSGLVTNGNTSSGLQSLAADLIERVEIITNPSVKYEAEGTAGIINIVLKKEKKRGLTGALSLSVAHPKVLNTALSMNVNREKIKLYCNFSFNDYINLGVGKALQIARPEDNITSVFKSSSINNFGGPSGNFRIGSDINLREHTLLTASLSYFIIREDHFLENTYRDFLNDLNNPVGGSIRTENRFSFTQRREFVSTYEKEFAQNKQTITADLRLNLNSRDADSDFLESFFLMNSLPSNKDDVLQQSAFQEEESRIIAKLDYTLPLNEKEKFEMGWQSSIRNIHNDFSFEEYTSGEWTVSAGLTNSFHYDEYIHATYALYKTSWNDLSFQVGLRTEYSIVETSLPQNNLKKYINFFPSIHLSKELPANNTIQLSYSRRIKRPRSSSLNPFISWDDNRAFFGGNPNLNPEMTDIYEVGHVKKWDKGALGSFIFYRHTIDVIEGVVREIERNGVPVFFRQPDNLNSKDDIGLEFNISYAPNNWWKINSDFFVFSAVINGTNVRNDMQSKTLTGMGRITSKMTIFKDFDLQLRLNYQAPKNIVQGRSRAMTYLNAGFSKKILADKGKLTFNASDIFTSRRIRNHFETENLFRENDYLWNATRIRATLNYQIK